MFFDCQYYYKTILWLIGLPSGWQTTDIYVRIADSDWAGQTGIIRDVKEASCLVYLSEEARTVDIDNDNLEPIMPKSNDFVKVLCGSYRDRTGKMMAIEGSEGVVVLTDEKNPILIPLLHLCRAH